MPLLAGAPMLAVLFAAMLLYMIIVSWDTTFGPLLENLAEKLRVSIRIPVIHRHIDLSFIGDAISSWAHAYRRGLGIALSGMLSPLVALLHYAEALFVWPAKEIYYLARDTTSVIQHLRRFVIPAMIAAAIHWIPKHLARLDARVDSLYHALPWHILRDILNRARTIARAVVHHAISVVLPRIGRLERETKTATKRIDRIAKKVLPAALLASFVVALKKFGLTWIRCSKVKRVGKQVCGMDESLLESLVADTLLVVGTISLVEFAQGLQAGMGEITPQVRRFWGVR